MPHRLLLLALLAGLGLLLSPALADKPENAGGKKDKSAQSDEAKARGQGQANRDKTNKGHGRDADGESAGGHPEDAGKPENSGARGREKALERQDAAILKQMEREEDKHRRRVAKLERIRDVLAEKGNDQAVGRVDEVLNKEHERHDRAIQRLRERSDAAGSRFDDRIEKVGKVKRSDKARGKPDKDDGDDDADGHGREKNRDKARSQDKDKSARDRDDDDDSDDAKDDD